MTKPAPRLTKSRRLLKERDEVIARLTAELTTQYAEVGRLREAAIPDPIEVYRRWWAVGFEFLAVLTGQLDTLRGEIKRPDSPLAGLVDPVCLETAHVKLNDADLVFATLALKSPSVPDPLVEGGGP